MNPVQTWRFASFDGVELAVHEAGAGPPVLLLHGLFSSAQMNWIKFGHAAQLVAAGFRVIMPDLRAHGASDAPHDASAYPTDVLVQDILALIDHHGFDSFDLGGFSLGARTVAKLLAAGVRPRRAIISGMGWQGLTSWGNRRQFFVDAIDARDTAQRGDPHWLAVQFMKTNAIDPVAVRHLLMSFGKVDTDALQTVPTRVLVICGKDDADNGSAPLLAEKLRDASYVEINGTHMSSVVEKSLGAEMAAFLVLS